MDCASHAENILYNRIYSYSGRVSYPGQLLYSAVLILLALSVLCEGNCSLISPGTFILADRGEGLLCRNIIRKRRLI